MVNSFSMKITSPISTIDLPYSITFSKMKVKTMRYVTYTANNNYLLVNLQECNTNNTYFDSTTSKQYTKWIPLNPTISTFHYYENINDEWDFVVSNKEKNESTIRQFKLECLIDGAYSSDISASNPLYIELYFA